MGMTFSKSSALGTLQTYKNRFTFREAVFCWVKIFSRKKKPSAMRRVFEKENSEYF